MKRLIVLIAFTLTIATQASADVQFKKEKTQLHIGKNNFLHLNIKRPVNVEVKSIPAVLLFGGFETSDRSIELVNPDKPIMIVTFAYPFKGPKKVSVLKDYKLIPEIKSALHQTLTGIEQLVEWVKLQPEVNPEDIYLAGVSFGAPLAAMSANESIKGLILVHGFIDIESTMAYSLGIRFGKSYGWFGKIFAKILSKWAWWYLDLPSPKEKLKAMKFGQRVLVYTSEGDDLLPKSAAEDIRAAIKKTDVEWEERMMPGYHIRSDETEMIQRLVNEAIAWIGKN